MAAGEEDDNSVGARQVLAAWRAGRPDNYLQADLNIQRVLRLYLGNAYAEHEPMLSQAASLAATRMDRLAIDSNRDENLPRLERFDAIGERREDIVFHPAYHELGACVWGTGVLSVLREPGNEVLSGALTYFITHNGEAGHACPVACTAGLIKLLQQVGSTRQKTAYLPGLLESDYGRCLRAAQFVTEIQGGSDVGTNSCRAVPDDSRPGWYRLRGEKWFCSVIDADLFLVTARPRGSAAGTRGLGLFLVPRRIDGITNDFSVRRLKYKLGTRSLASAEVDFEGALGEPVGPLSHGFRHLMGIVIDTSRVHNAIAACGLMRRACIEARGYARHREAFGKTLAEHPPIAQILARMTTVTTAAVAATFRILAMNDRLAGRRPPPGLAEARRTHVNINKYWTAVQCSRVVRDAIEVLGGNGTIEDFSVLPRLYRDAMVLESWEGTHNTLCAQVLRDFTERGLHRPWLAEMRQSLARVAHPALAEQRARAAALLDEVAGRIHRLLHADAEYAALHIRSVVERMCTAHGFLSLLLELDWELDWELNRELDWELNRELNRQPTRAPEQVDGDEKTAILALYRHLYVDRTDAMEDSDLPALVRTLAAPRRQDI